MSTVPPCSALLFDLDGTLVDSRRDIAGSLNAALRVQGRAELSLEQVLPMIGDGARMLVMRALGPDAPATLVDATAALFQEHYLAHPCVHTTLLPGARELLALDRPVALVTNKPRPIAVRLLEELGVVGRFRSIWGGGSGPLKPAPDGVLAVARELGVPLSATWLVGDGHQDVLAGRAAGCFTVAVPGIAERERVLAAEPHLVVETLLDLLPLLQA